MKRINVKGTIVSNDDHWIYKWFGMDATCPKDIEKGLIEANGEDITVEINSGGGDVFAGNEIYYKISSYQGRTMADIVGFAGSAATIVACGAEKVRMIPSAMYMIHNVASSASGDFHAMDHNSDILQKANKSISNVYQIKTGMSEEELLALMDKETWMEPQRAVELGFVDEIIQQENNIRLVNSCMQMMIPEKSIEKFKNIVGNPVNKNPDFFMQKNKAELQLLRLKGGFKNEV